MAKEILINHSEISDNKTITNVMTEKFKANDVDIHRHEVINIDDDFKKGIRKIEVKATKYFTVGDIPWHRK